MPKKTLNAGQKRIIKQIIEANKKAVTLNPKKK